MNGKSLFALALSCLTLLNGLALESPSAAQKAVTANIAEIVKMNDSGVSEQVIKEFIANSSTIFEPRADEIIYLHNHGISGDIITSLIKRGSALKKNLPAPPLQAPIVTRAPAPAQAPVIVQQQPIIQTVPIYQPVYDPVPVYVYNYSYPWYSYYRSPYAYRPLYTHYRHYSPWRYPSAHVSFNLGGSYHRGHIGYSRGYNHTRFVGGHYSGGRFSGGAHHGGGRGGGRHR